MTEKEVVDEDDARHMREEDNRMGRVWASRRSWFIAVEYRDGSLEPPQEPLVEPQEVVGAGPDVRRGVPLLLARVGPLGRDLSVFLVKSRRLLQQQVQEIVQIFSLPKEAIFFFSIIFSVST